VIDPVSQWELGHPPSSWEGLLGLTLVGLYLALAVLNLRVTRPGAARRVAFGLQILLAVLLALLVLQPVQRISHRQTRSASTVIVVDDSHSMTLPHPLADHRTEVAASLLDRLRERVPDAHVVQVSGGALEPDAPLSSASPASPILARLEALVERGLDGRVPDRVVLLTDLQDNDEGFAAERFARLLRAVSASPRPVMTALDLGVGEGHGDVAVRAIRADTVAFYKNVTRARVEVDTGGLEAGTLTVSFGQNGRWEAAESVKIEPDRRRVQVPFRYRPDHAGRIVLAARVALAGADEAANAANDTAYTTQTVLRDRLRVLHLAGHPSWDVRFLREAFRAMGGVDLISFYIMVRPSAFFVENMDETALIPFPAHTLFEEELGGFDLIVLQNFRVGAFETDRYAEEILSYVRGGGAAWIIGGELTFLSESLPASPLARLFPFPIPPFRTYRDYFTFGSFRPALTDAGRRHPIFDAPNMPSALSETLAALPALEGANLQGCVDEAASVLLSHPRARTDCGRLPILTVSEFANGRVAFLGTDTLWHWAFQPQAPERDGFHRALVENTVRWLTRDPELSAFQVEATRTDRPSEDGQGGAPSARSYRVRARFQREVEERAPATWAFHAVEWGGTERERVRVQTTSEPSFDWRPTHPGLYWLELERRGAPGSLKRRLPILVERSSDELLEPARNRDALRNLILASGGAIYPATDRSTLPSLPEVARHAVVQTERREPMASLWWLAVVLALLSAAWYTRTVHGS
jgi:hypothetical protein